MKFYRLRYLYFYRQYRPMPSGLFIPLAYGRLDCSSSNTLQYKEGGAPDPNGFGYNGYGYTGTLWVRGESVVKPRPGDLAFYGHQQPGNIPSHVAIVVDANSVVSFGSTPVKYLPIYYRGDFRGFRSHLP